MSNTVHTHTHTDNMLEKEALYAWRTLPHSNQSFAHNNRLLQ